jgi:hypothetical protein
MSSLALLFATVVAWHGEPTKTYPLAMRAARAAIVAAHASDVTNCHRLSGRTVSCSVIRIRTHLTARATLITTRPPHVRVVFTGGHPTPALTPRGGE